MRILWSYLAMLLIVYETSSQLTRQQSFSQSGNVVPYILYFDVILLSSLGLRFADSNTNIFHPMSKPANHGRKPNGLHYQQLLNSWL